MGAAQETPVQQVDLSAEVCPMTFVKAKLYLEALQPGELIEFVLNAGEHMRSVPRSIKEDGHRVEAVHREGGKCRLLVRRGEP